MLAVSSHGACLRPLGCYYSPKQALCPEIILIHSLSLSFHNITALLLLTSSQTFPTSPSIWDPSHLPDEAVSPQNLCYGCHFIFAHNQALQPLHHFYCLFSSKFPPESPVNSPCEDPKENSPNKKHPLISKGAIFVQGLLISLIADTILAGSSIFCDTRGITCCYLSVGFLPTPSLFSCSPWILFIKL